MESEVMVFGHALCPGVAPVRGLLARSNVPHVYLDIRKDASAAERVRAINEGNESVPTLIFPDGSSLTEPSVGELKAKLEVLGYRVGKIAWLIGNAWKLITAAVVVYGALRLFEVI
jgi:mycoredoxin